MIRTYRASLKKDLKLLFRSWETIFLIVVGPLALMLILVSAFSNLGFNEINIGFVVTEQAEKYKDFIPKLGYIGHFQEYNDIFQCNNALRTQKLHLCLELTSSSLKIHFDNTREIISLILLDQIRVAMNIEKEELLRKQATGLLGTAREAEDFMEQSSDNVGDVLDDLDEQRDSLVETKREIQDIKLDVDNRIVQIENARTSLLFFRNQADRSVQANVDDAVSLLNQADTYLLFSYNQAMATNDWTTANEFSNLRDDMSNVRYQVTNSQGVLREGVNQADAIIEEMGKIIGSLNKARNVLQRSERKIDDAVRKIDQRTVELQQLQRDISSYQIRLDDLGNTNVEDIVRPVDLDFRPLFLASKRLQNFDYDADLTIEQKQRLVNLGTTQTFVPLIIVLLISFIATILANILLLDEIHSPAFLRNHIVPSSWMTRFLSQFSAILMITFAQVVVILGISFVIFFLDLIPSIGTIAIVLGLLIGTYSIVGMIIAYLIRTKTTSLLVSAFFLIINILLGGVLYPVERMAPFMSSVSKAIPFTAGISMLQQSIFYNVSLRNLLYPLLQMLGIFLAALVVLFLARLVFIRRYTRGG